MKIAIGLSVAMVASGVAQATGGSPASADHSSPQRVYTYAIDLDAEGNIRALSPHESLPDAVSRALREQIGAWVFEPVAARGQSLTTKTFLRVVTAPDDGPAGFRVVSATTGPVPERLTQPDYPARDQFNGRQGMVVLKLQIDKGGQVAAVDVHAVSGKISRAMANAAKTSALEWKFTPEIVGTQSVASTILWPVCYLGMKSSASECVWQGPDAQRFSSVTVLPLNPAVRLVSPLALQTR